MHQKNRDVIDENGAHNCDKLAIILFHIRTISHAEVLVGCGDSGLVFVGPLQRVRPRNGIFVVVVVLVVVLVPLRSEFIGEL